MAVEMVWTPQNGRKIYQFDLFRLLIYNSSHPNHKISLKRHWVYHHSSQQVRKLWIRYQYVIYSISIKFQPLSTLTHWWARVALNHTVESPTPKNMYSTLRWSSSIFKNFILSPSLYLSRSQRKAELALSSYAAGILMLVSENPKTTDLSLIFSSNPIS